MKPNQPNNDKMFPGGTCKKCTNLLLDIILCSTSEDTVRPTGPFSSAS